MAVLSFPRHLEIRHWYLHIGHGPAEHEQRSSSPWSTHKSRTIVFHLASITAIRVDAIFVSSQPEDSAHGTRARVSIVPALVCAAPSFLSPGSDPYLSPIGKDSKFGKSICGVCPMFLRTRKIRRRGHVEGHYQLYIITRTNLSLKYRICEVVIFPIN